MDEGDDILSQALQEAEIQLEDDLEKSQLTQQNYIVETEPVTDSDSGLDALLDIVAENNVSDTQLNAIEHAVDISGMGGPHGPCEVGARAVYKPGVARTYQHAEESSTSSTDVTSEKGETKTYLRANESSTSSTDVTSEKGTSRRFIHVCCPMIEEHGREFVPPNTMRKNKWSMNVLSKWIQEFLSDADNARGECSEAYSILQDCRREIHELLDSELTTVLCIFLIALKKENGDEYPGESVLSIICGIQRHFRHQGREVDFFNNPVFSRLKQTIDNVMQKKCQRGIGIKKRQAEVISQAQEDILWNKCLLGSSTPQGLVDTIFWIVGINFGLRGGEEHRRLSFQNFDVAVDSDGHKYLQYTETVSKTYRGGLKHRKIDPHSARAYENSDPERCPVKLFELYRSVLPADRDPSIFYFRPLSIPKEQVWFSKQGIGHNKLDAVVKQLMNKAGVEGYYTNHSLRASTATRLYNAGVGDQLVKEQTGHRSLAVENYKRTSDGQKRDVSKILQGDKEPVEKGTKLDASSEAEVEPNRGFMFENCSNITINKYY